MNQLKARFHRELSIKIGYAIEMFSFILSGIFVLVSFWAGFCFMVIGAVAGSIVTKKIEQNALENYKWGLE